MKRPSRHSKDVQEVLTAMLDILIKGGTVLDGSGAPRFKGDVGIKDGLIAKVAPSIDEEAERVIDAKGLFVTPGFIDTHSHADDLVFYHSDSYNCIEQGITTVLTGNCGVTPAPFPFDTPKNPIKRPVSDERRAEILKICENGATYIEEAKKTEFGVNIAFLIGHCSVRAHAMGMSPEKPTKEQMEDMKNSVRIAMEAGYYGFSTGLVYAPSVYGDVDEIAELAAVAAEYGGVYASHIRGEGNNLINAIAEAIEVGKKSGAPVLISHIKVMGKSNLGKSRQVLKMIHEARDSGMNIFADQYPYDSGSAPLISQIPPKFLTEGAVKTLEHLKDPKFRDEIEWSIFNESDEFESIIYDAGYEGSTISDAAKTPQYVGKNLAQIAEEMGVRPIDAMCELLITNGVTVQGIYKCQNEEDILVYAADPLVFAGTDWGNIYEHHDINKQGGCHPRGISTMIRRIELIRDNNLRTPEETIRTMTGGPALAMGFEKRGFLKEGYAADVCVFDYEKIRANSDYVHPYLPNEGLEYVLVNGVVDLEHGKCLGKMAGQVLLNKGKK